MKLYTNTSEIDNLKNTVVTIGTFDGVHEGHLEIIRIVKEKARSLNCESVLITFEPHPRVVLAKDFNIKLLTTLEEKKIIFNDQGIDNLFVLNFTGNFSQMTSEDFVKDILCKQLGARHLIVGYDHRFGKNRDGDENQLRDLGRKYKFEVTTVGSKIIDNVIVSSTKIRHALQDGDIKKASKMLGRNYSLIGTVVEGAKRGRLLGFPTANIKVSGENKLIPSNGVYFVKCYYKDDEIFGIVNIGVRPTFDDSKELIVEVHLFEFNQNIYDHEMKIEFIEFLRAEKKFASKEELVNQIKLDIKEAKKIQKNI